MFPSGYFAKGYFPQGYFPGIVVVPGGGGVSSEGIGAKKSKAYWIDDRSKEKKRKEREAKARAKVKAQTEANNLAILFLMSVLVATEEERTESYDREVDKIWEEYQGAK